MMNDESWLEIIHNPLNQPRLIIMDHQKILFKKKKNAMIEPTSHQLAWVQRAQGHVQTQFTIVFSSPENR